MNYLINNYQFLPEIYYSFCISNEILENISLSFKKTMLLKNNIYKNLNFNNYSSIIGVREDKKIKIKGELLNNCELFFIDNIEIVGNAKLEHFLYLENCLIDNLIINENYHFNAFHSHLIFNHCQFKNELKINNNTNILFNNCNLIKYSNLNIINMIYINLKQEDIIEKYYIYNFQSAILNVYLYLYKHIKQNYLFKPSLIFKNNQYYLKLIKENVIYLEPIQYCISPGLVKPNSNKGINLYTFLLNAIGKQSMVVIPNGVYYLDTEIEIDYHLIGIGFPIINILEKGLFIVKKNFIIIEGFKFKNFSSNIIFFIYQNNITLMNIFIHNEKNPNKSSKSLIIIQGNNNFINNIWLYNNNRNYEYGIVNMGNNNVLLSIFTDSFLKSNIYNLGNYLEIIYFNNEVIHNQGIISSKKLILLGSSFFSFSVINENFFLTIDSIIKNSFVIYLDDYHSIFHSRLLYFPYFINYEKFKKDDSKIKKIIYHYSKQLFLLVN